MHFDRRTLLRAGTAGLAASLGPWWASTARAHGSRLFTLGVASGDPTFNSAVLWTRLAPAPLDGGGMDERPVAVRWEVATDPWMRRVVRRGEVLAHPEWGHTVHVTPKGLDSDRWYWYRFHAQGEDSPIGRTRTFPWNHSISKAMGFGLVSCQDYQNGFWSAYASLAQEELGFVVHAGDYIYEDGTRPLAPRQVPAPEIITLDDYRNRYALYRLDPALQAAHAAFPFVTTFDDHEVDNNHAGDIPEDDQDPAAFTARKTAAYRAYYEHLPVADAVRPRGASIDLFRRLSFGNLVDLHVLDTRQFRTDQPCGDGLKPVCPATLDPAATMMGSQQERWLAQGLSKSDAVWNVLGQQVMMMKWNIGPAIQPGVPFFNMDAWDGYVAARQRLLDFLASGRGPANVVVLTGDIHSAWAADIWEDFERPDSGVLARSSSARRSRRTSPPRFCPRSRRRCLRTRTSSTSRACTAGTCGLR
jgi:alkaline phosphatase D